MPVLCWISRHPCRCSGMAPVGWRCATCGATNQFGNRRCRLCQTMVPPGLLPEAPPDDASSAEPTPATAAAAAPAYTPHQPYQPPPIASASPMPPPGGWSAPDPALQSLPPPPLPPPPLPPGSYAPPPQGWYPGAPQPPARKRRGWLVALCIAIPVVIIGVLVLGIGYARGTDPEAAR